MKKDKCSIKKHMSGKAILVASVLMLAGCASETLVRGQNISSEMMEQVKVGSTQEQVLAVFGTPSTTSTIGGQTYYYISQKEVRNLHFMGSKLQDQRVVAITFDGKRRVSKIADYGMKDGQVFDFVSKTTPAGGEEQSFLGQIFKAVNFSGGF